MSACPKHDTGGGPCYCPGSVYAEAANTPVIGCKRPDGGAACIVPASGCANCQNAIFEQVAAPAASLLEERVERAIFPIFGVPFPLPACIKTADLILLATEQRDLMPAHDDEWALIKEIKPLQESIMPMTPGEAFSAFMQRYEELGGVMG